MTEQEGQMEHGPAEPLSQDPGAAARVHGGYAPPRDFVVAWFADEGAARGCARSLTARGVEVALTGLAGAPDDDAHGRDAGDAGSPQERGMGSGAVVGATVGATAGLLAASYLVPPAGGSMATGAMLTTLAGAGLGSFLGGLADQAPEPAGSDGGPTAAPGRAEVRLEARVEAARADEVLAVIAAWGPREVRRVPAGGAAPGAGDEAAGGAEATGDEAGGTWEVTDAR